MGDITAALQAWNRGEPEAFDELFPLVTKDLRRLAQVYMQQEDPDHTLQATEVVSEIFLRMTGRKAVDFTSRADFFAFAGQLIRWLLTEHARRRKSLKRGGQVEIVPLTGSLAQEVAQQPDPKILIDLNRALEELKELDPRAVNVLELGYFGGMTQREIATALNISRTTVQRDWEMVHRWLQQRLGPAEDED